MHKESKKCLISVSDKQSILPLAQTLIECGYAIITSSGTHSYLKSNDIQSIKIEEYTGHKEILDGRVKTLHPKIHGGLLAKKSEEAHIRQLAENDIDFIDIVVINLYPFLESINSGVEKTFDAMIELIDIGGPAMLRASAKNCLNVLPVIDPSDYTVVIEGLKNKAAFDVNLRIEFAKKVFTHLSYYDLQIAKYLSKKLYNASTLKESDVSDISTDYAPIEGIVLKREASLRYGENPHQKAAFYREYQSQDVSSTADSWTKLHGKDLSYNNILDIDAALNLVYLFKSSALDGFTKQVVSNGTQAHFAAILKHLNPCGVAIDKSSLLSALKKAKLGDPRSHFGGIMVFNSQVLPDVADEIKEDFAEVIIAPSYDSEALNILTKNKNLRIITFDPDRICKNQNELRTVEGGYLLQKKDLHNTLIGEDDIEEGTVFEGSQDELQRIISDINFAFRIATLVKSNAIVVAKDLQVQAVGAGQMSRIDSVEIAINKAKFHNHAINGSVAASDAFFPFPDSVEKLAEEGIKAIVAPFGAKRDNEILQSAKKNNVMLFWVKERHFKH
jgi:phosphoribosylaminoimidazolecarboxamide formyltransferase / IMP cyclohydrolase